MDDYKNYCEYNSNIFDAFYPVSGEKINKISNSIKDKVFYLGFLNGLRETWRDEIVVGKTGVWGLYAGWRDIKPEKLGRKEKTRDCKENNTKNRKKLELELEKIMVDSKETEFLIFCKKL